MAHQGVLTNRTRRKVTSVAAHPPQSLDTTRADAKREEREHAVATQTLGPSAARSLRNLRRDVILHVRRVRQVPQPRVHPGRKGGCPHEIFFLVFYTRPFGRTQSERGESVSICLSAGSPRSRPPRESPVRPRPSSFRDGHHAHGFVPSDKKTQIR